MTARNSCLLRGGSPALLLSGLIALHTVDGRMVFINPAQITQVREPLPESSTGRQLTTGVQCVITLTDRSFAAVREDCAKVYRAAETAERGGLAVEKPGKGVRNVASIDHLPAAVGDHGGAGAAGGGAEGGNSAGGAGGSTAGGGSGAGGSGGAGGGGGGQGGQGGGGGGGGSGGGNGNGNGNGQGGSHGDNGHHGSGNSGNGKGGK